MARKPKFDISTLRSHADWKWYGYAGHLIVSRHCAYHLCTRVGDYLVSTVGAYYPTGHSNQKMVPIGAGADSFFETYVFRCGGEKDGDPIILSYGEISGTRYVTSIEAERGHYDHCWRYQNDHCSAI